MNDAAAFLHHPSPPGLENGSVDEPAKRRAREGEEELMLAILDDAVACFQKYVDARDDRSQALFREAEQWILEEKSDWIFSFENICEVLGFDSRYVRRGLLQWKDRTPSTRPKAKVFRLPYKSKGRRPPRSGS